jgi:ActR/RegA family two-component response regulator
MRMALSRECSPHILIVEDDAVWARLLITGLEPRGDVTWAQTLADARTQLENRIFDLVLVDLQLGTEPGHSIPQLARRFNPRTRVLLISGNPSIAHIASEVLADAWLSKPVRLKDLRTSVDTLLARTPGGRIAESLSWEAPVKHAMALFGSDEERLATGSSFLADGLRQGRRGIAVLERGLHERMKERIVQASGRPEPDLVLLAAETVCERVLDAGLPSRKRFSSLAAEVLQDAAGTPLRFYGDAVDLLSRRGRHRAAIQLEAMWNEVIPAADAQVLCGYSRSSLDGAACGCLQELVDHHDLCARAV